MGPYIILFFILFICVILSAITANRNAKLYYLGIECIAMAVMTGFRALSVGTDTVMYYNIYSWMRLYNSKYCPMETGYCELNKQMASVGVDYPVLLAVEGLILYSGLFVFVWQLVDQSLWVSVPLLFYVSQSFFNSLNISRQYFAMGFVLLAATLFYKKKRVFGLFFLFIGLSIHYSSFIIVLVYILMKVIKKKAFSSAAVLLYILSIGIRMIGPDKMFQTVISIVPKYNHYIGSTEFATLGSFQFVFFTILIPNCLFIMCYLINYFNKELSLVGSLFDYKYSLFLSGGLLYLCFMNAFTGSQALARFADIFVAFYIAYICSTLAKIKDKRVLILVWIIIVLVMTISCYYFIGIRGYQAVIPYEFWQNN